MIYLKTQHPDFKCFHLPLENSFCQIFTYRKPFLGVYISRVLTHVQISVQYPHYQNSERLYRSRKLSSCRPFVVKLFTHPSPLVSIDLFPHLCSLVFSRVSYKWNQIGCNLWRLASFPQHNAFEIHQVCECTTVFIHSPVGHLCCFRFGRL